MSGTVKRVVTRTEVVNFHDLKESEKDEFVASNTIPFDQIQTGKCYMNFYKPVPGLDIAWVSKYQGRLLEKKFLYNDADGRPVYDLFFAKTVLTSRKRGSTREPIHERYMSPLTTMYNKHNFIEIECDIEDSPMTRRSHALFGRMTPATATATRRRRKTRKQRK
jgi:hypothetical protein